MTTAIEEMGRHWPMEKLPGRPGSWSRLWRSRSGSGSAPRAATGGASDANTTAGMGVPTLDGGPIGGNDHATGEYLDLDSIVPGRRCWPSSSWPVGREGAPPGRA